jgi:S-layer homology domain
MRTSSASGTFDCIPSLPTGSKLVRIEIVAYDASDAGAVNINLVQCQSLDVNDGCAQTGLVATAGTAAVPYDGRLVADLSGNPIVVDKTSELDLVRVYLTSGGVDLQFREVDFFYQLQVSTPAPGAQTFGDVLPSNLYYKGIEALAASGITGGCGNGNFCPGQFVTRGEIATFFARALGLNFPN